MTEYITLAVCKELLEVQEKSFRTLVTMLSNDMKSDINQLKSDIIDIKNSLQYSGKDIDVLQKKINDLDSQLSEIHGPIDNHDTDLGHVVNKQDYLENQSCQNNLRLTGMGEEGRESWEDTEALVKAKIKDLLKIDKELTIERARHVKISNKSSSGRHQTSETNRPRPIIAKFVNWKEKEEVLASARKIRPPGVKFVQDLSHLVLDRRQDQVPKMLEARSKGKVAYFVCDRLIIKYRCVVSSNVMPQNEDSEISFTLSPTN